MGKATPCSATVELLFSRSITAARNLVGSRIFPLAFSRADDFTERFVPRLAPASSARFVFHRGDRREQRPYDGQRICWIITAKPVIQLTTPLWQLKTFRPPHREATISLQKSLYDPGYVNAMSHFYRGELGRIMVWRQRLDITTNWAITSSTAIITIAFSNREVPHIIFFFNLAIVWVMLWIEARRYRFYDAFRARVACWKRISLSRW